MSEAAQDVVVCTGCGKSYRVKPELAGRKAKCKCGETVRFPAAAAPAMVEPLESPNAEGSYDITEPVKPVAAPAPVQKMGACKGCTAPMPAAAVLCTRCGMNQKTGKKMGTQVQGAGPDAGDVVMAAGKVALSLILGGVTAIVCTVLWFVVIAFTGLRTGIFILPIGAGIAAVIRLINPYGSPWAGMSAAVLTFLSYATVRGLLMLGALQMGLPPYVVFSVFDPIYLIGAVSIAYKMAAGLTR